jgi:hypothetical protein
MIGASPVALVGIGKSVLMNPHSHVRFAKFIMES